MPPTPAKPHRLQLVVSSADLARLRALGSPLGPAIVAAALAGGPTPAAPTRPREAALALLDALDAGPLAALARERSPVAREALRLAADLRRTLGSA